MVVNNYAMFEVSSRPNKRTRGEPDFGELSGNNKKTLEGQHVLNTPRFMHVKSKITQ